mgnify:CR=1 FL=1
MCIVDGTPMLFHMLGICTGGGGAFAEDDFFAGGDEVSSDEEAEIVVQETFQKERKPWTSYVERNEKHAARR